MLVISKCWERRCKSFIGVSQPDGTEETERYICKAFPEQVPHEISFGNELHLKPLAGQENEIVFEPTRIELIKCTDPYTHLKPGEKGTVDHIDHIGTIHVKWDNGSRLGLIPGVDDWKEIEE